MNFIRTGLLTMVALVLISCGGKPQQEKENISAEAEGDKKETVSSGSYKNENLGYSITYPKDILVLQTETEGTDEQVFSSTGTAKLRIYKDERKNKEGKVLTFNEAFEVDRATSKDRQISYSVLKPLFYVVSGVENGSEIFYQKTIESKGVVVTAKLIYTKEERPTFDAMISPLFNSFK